MSNFDSSGVATDIIINVDSDSLDNAASQLQFQNFPTTQSTSSDASKTYTNPLPNEEDSREDEDDVLLAKGQKQNIAAFWELAYFARFFDVTTQDVVSRVLWSVLPIPSPPAQGNKSRSSGTYIERHIQSSPDLYGPIWINITLIFSIAICGNIASYLASPLESDWHYDFKKVGMAASTVTTYVLCVPTCLWFFFWFRGCTLTYTWLETLCAYGYSLSVYVPISIVWMFGIPLVQYALVIAGALLSGSVLVLSFAPVVQSDPSQTVKFSYVMLLLIIGMHALVAFSFLTYFF
ncbi:Protein YIPF1 [Halotydeus destructor]|nr:Protein YIPF1 [Halotydeus destructor]